MTILALTRTSTALIAVMPLLASCASWGLYNMSDEWCAKHVDATPAHCPGNHNARAAGRDQTLTVTADAPRAPSEPGADPQG
jgi:hypothetical protein